MSNLKSLSKLTAPKSVILSKFLQVGPENDNAQAPEEVQKKDYSDKKSLTANVSLGTETLAVILEKQGRYDKALAIYKNLLSNNPEKSSIFAPRIQKLESLLNSK